MPAGSNGFAGADYGSDDVNAWHSGDRGTLIRTPQPSGPASDARLYLILTLIAIVVATALLPLAAEIVYPTERSILPTTAAAGWTIQFLALHLTVDVLVGLIYISVAGVVLILAWRASRPLPLLWLYVAFGLCIVACGLAPFLAAVTPWPPLRWLADHVKSVTAVMGIAITLTVPPLAPQVVALIDAVRLSEERRQRLEITTHDLAAAEERFRTAFAHAPIGMALVDLRGRFLEVNRALCLLTGYATAELQARTLQDISHPADVKADLALLRRLVAGEMPSYELEKRFVAADGSVVWGRVAYSLVHDDEGRPLHVIGQVEDITERKRAEEELRRSEARFRSLISNATDIITILDADGVVQDQSPSIEHLLGYDPEGLLGRNGFELVHPEDRAATRAAFSRTLADPVAVPTVEFRVRHAGGEWRWLAATGANLLADPDVAGVVINSRDVTDRKIAECELRQALEAAQAANRATNQFLALMSHELRTPLQSVLGYAELLLLNDGRGLSSDQAEDVQAIRRGAERVVALVGQMLDLSRMEAGQLTLEIKPMRLAEVIEQVRQDAAPLAAAKGLELAVTVPPDLPMISGDAERVRQIVLNLVGNAVKFTEAGTVSIDVRRVHGGLQVAVSDTGIGIAPDALPHIFMEFRQAEAGLTRRYNGAGLGLAIAKRLAEQHGGHLGVTSQPGAGSIFTLVLPAADMAEVRSSQLVSPPLAV